jgi:radical SAM protein with 4Fe4S-binding SPASM domain
MPYPNIVVLFTSYRCNARCVMCSAWQKQKDYKELNTQDIAYIFSDKIISSYTRRINITGGEPTLREDLLEIIKIVSQKCTHLERIDLSTNGINTIEVIDRTEQILAYLLQTDIKLTVSVSIDGVNEVHDRIRNVPGAFEKINRTIDELKELALLYPTISLGINATISRINYANLHSILEYSTKKNLGINFTLAAYSEIGVESRPLESAFKLDSQGRKATSVFIENLLEKNQINIQYGKLLLHWLKTGMRNGNCAFRKGISILCEPDGSLYQCGNFRDFKIGNLLQRTFKDIIKYNKNNFRKLYEMKCKYCNSNCYIETIYNQRW